MRLATIAIVATLCLLIVAKVSVAELFSRSYPARALFWAPDHGEAQASAAARLVSADRPDEARRLAAAALRRSPLNVVALRSLGLAAEAKGNAPQVIHFMGLANAVSRRDLPTQMWMIGNSVRRGDYPAAVRQFDLAMRSSSRGTDQLIPLLVAASADRRALPPIAGALNTRPDWLGLFFDQLARSNIPAEHVAVLIRGRLRPAQPEERLLIQSNIRGLSERNRFDLAWLLFADAVGGAGANDTGPRDGGFETPDGFSPFDWTLGEEPDLLALRGPRPDGVRGNALFLSARNGRSGEVARQLFRLRPGRYGVFLQAGAVPAEPVQQPRLALTCATDGRALATLAAGQTTAVTQLRGSFSAPAGCDWIWARITIGAGDATPTDEPWVDNLVIRRLQ